MYNYDIEAVDGIDTLRERMENASSVEDWSFILSDYVQFGNSKLSDKVAIFNMNSATDCPNGETEKCQVDFNDCYAHKAENTYPNTLPYRRRQEYLWDCLDAHTFAKAFLKMVGRKHNKVTAIRFSEAGDFRHNGDIYKADQIAKMVKSEGITTYTYSASSDLTGWDSVEHMTVNQSNDFADYGDRLYTALPKDSELPDDAVWCPHDYQKSNGEENPIKCGDCKMCLTEDAGDIVIPLH